MMVSLAMSFSVITSYMCVFAGTECAIIEFMFVGHLIILTYNEEPPAKI